MNVHLEEEAGAKELEQATGTVKCLLLLSHAVITTAAPKAAAAPAALPLGGYECKTCNRRFPTFQALGGHRASHKRTRFAEEDGEQGQQQPHKHHKTRGHECAICGLEFAIGQALGGHMRRHRNIAAHGLTVGGAPPAAAVPAEKAGAVKAHFFDLNFPPLEDLPNLQLCLTYS